MSKAKISVPPAEVKSPESAKVKVKVKLKGKGPSKTGAGAKKLISQMLDCPSCD